MFKYFRILFFIGALSLLNADESSLSKDVIYLENHDPSVIIINTENGQETLQVAYSISTISWENVNEWKQEKSLKYEFNVVKGGYLVDSETDKKLYVIGGFTTHPIDELHNNCLETPIGQSTMGMIDCNNQAYDNWDHYLNHIYKTLSAQLQKETKTSLRKSQRNWIQFRDAQEDSMREMMGSKEGTMWGIIMSSNSIEITKSQTLRLAMYLSDLVY
jgi:uncharacterized protein YecT (DUF1311 family)